MEKKVPVRTCICCRTAKPKKELLRIVRTEEGFVLDFSGKLNGRGAYVCNDEKCFNRLKKQKALNRAFSENVSETDYKRVEEAFFELKKQG